MNKIIKDARETNDLYYSDGIHPLMKRKPSTTSWTTSED